uniref:Uncharacterized protein n=1 Tax=uncultured marine microorganism HF4000_APKG10F13 TaxID=455557 RepID=B3TBT5_9ZZZZ|nr:hypothetical protein ALOHA_HF4000APKG10F13ctg1g28 [uncultured marine microorganism HF4000_APKG10F13]
MDREHQLAQRGHLPAATRCQPAHHQPRRPTAKRHSGDGEPGHQNSGSGSSPCRSGWNSACSSLISWFSSSSNRVLRSSREPPIPDATRATKLPPLDSISIWQMDSSMPAPKGGGIKRLHPILQKSN